MEERTPSHHGSYSTILGTDILPTLTNQTIIMTNDILHIGTTLLSLLIADWNDCNNIAYNQILICISPELQTAIDNTDIASKAWNILLAKFESMDPSKISIIRTRYENYHMIEGQLVITYITTMKEFRNQLKRMGEMIPDSTHVATLLWNIPESWRLITQTIRMITCSPDEIKEHLEVHEADLFLSHLRHPSIHPCSPCLTFCPYVPCFTDIRFHVTMILSSLAYSFLTPFLSFLVSH